MANISYDERERRRRAAEFARTSLGLEGMNPSMVCLEKTRRFIDGEIDFNEFLQESHQPSIRPYGSEITS